MVLDSLVEADILATCNALGSEIRGVYRRGSDCLECLRDLLRYLRRDDEERAILRQLGSIRLLQTDLLPLLKTCGDSDHELFDFVLRLLVALTNPAILVFKEDAPEDKLSCHVYLQLVAHLQAYKRAFADPTVWRAIAQRLKLLLAMAPMERSDDESLQLERILIVTRNVLHVPAPDDPGSMADDDVSLHDQVLWCLHLAEIDSLLVYMATNGDEHGFCLHVLEIASLILREHSAEVLARSDLDRSLAEKQQDEKKLTEARLQEQHRQKDMRRDIGRARFNGTFYVKNVKSISEREYISHKLITNVNAIKFDAEKSFKRKPKNRAPLKEHSTTRQSTWNIRLFLRNFCIEFLRAYNVLMASVRSSLSRKSSEDHDDSYYLWAIRYFMEFNRRSTFQPEMVSETISVSMFHYFQTQIECYKDMMMAEKKKMKLWSKRIHLAVAAYHEILETLKAMESSKDENIRRNADIVASNVFYIVEYREMLLMLFSIYDEVKFSILYLSELVETTHLFFKLLEIYTKKHSRIIVQKKKRKTKKKQKPKSKEVSENQFDLGTHWDAIASNLSAAVQGRRIIPDDVTPFDATSEQTHEHQKAGAMFRIRDSLMEKETERALALLRASRELWPEGDAFGTPDVEPEDEFMILREIFFSELEEAPAVENAPLEEEEDEEEEDQTMPAFAEQQLDLEEVYKKYASPKVVHPCCLLLKNYKSNSAYTNYALVRVLYRIAWNCKMHALLFQASLFLIFQKLMKDPCRHSDPVIKELYRFSRYILSKFFEVMSKNDKIFVEMLFWKNSRDAYELEEGYGAGESTSSKSLWTEDDDEELRYLYEENKNVCIEGQDVVDVILMSLTKANRTRRQVILKLRQMGLIESIKDLKVPSRRDWQEVEILELQQLYDDHQNSQDVVSNILQQLTISRTKKDVVNKLLELGLIHDKKELTKKKRKKTEQSDDEDNAAREGDWQESEILQLQQLYEEHKDSLDVMSNIIQQLIISRSKKDVVNKLLELGLIHDKKELKKKKKRKKPEQSDEDDVAHEGDWQESEIIELQQLYEEHRNSQDVMSIMLQQLTISRSKRDIVNKLLELDLIHDKNELKKKHKTPKHNDDEEEDVVLGDSS